MTTTATTAAPAPGSALAALAALPVKGRAPRTGYDRAAFGQAWSDAPRVAFGRNGCGQRDDVLRRDLDAVTLRAGSGGCVVVTGLLADPYTGTTVRFTTDDADAVQVDHVVALSDAWQKGAQGLDPAARAALANDPLNLVATDGPTNRAKGDGDAATWLPPNRAVRCAYVARQVAVKARYRLWVTAAERDAVVRVLGTCPGEPLPADGTRRLVPAGTAVAPPDPGLDPRFTSCAKAKAAGYGPYRTGTDPEAGWYRDGDGDGVVCE